MRTGKCQRSPVAGLRSSQIDRWAIVGLASAVCLLAASCARSLLNPFRSTGPPPPEVLTAGASLDAIIAAVNSNAQRIQSYQTNNASITIPGSLGIPTLRGNIAAQRPGRVRLQASTAISGPEVDLGSNDQLYWFWVRRNEPPRVYYARHAEAAGSAARRLQPVDPQWLLDALGMAEFKPTDLHEGPLPIDDRRIEIKSTINSPEGGFTKRTVVDARTATILEQHLYDASGAHLASAIARSHRYYEETGASLPQQIELSVPPAELTMSIDVGTVELNRLASNPQLWELPVIPGSPAVDLSGAPLTSAGGGMPAVGQQLQDANWYDAPSTTPPLPVANPGSAVIPAAPPVTPDVAGIAMSGAAMGGPLVPPSAISAPESLSQALPSAGRALEAIDPLPQESTSIGASLPPGGVVASPTFTR